jgi:hypothetical protein
MKQIEETRNDLCGEVHTQNIAGQKVGFIPTAAADAWV